MASNTGEESDSRPPAWNCVSARKAECPVCLDIVMCENKDLQGCPHSVFIPITQLQKSSKCTNCQICHVFFEAVQPFVATLEDDLLANTDLVVAEAEHEGSCMVTVAPRESGNNMETRIGSFDSWHRVIGEKALYAAKIFSPAQRKSSWFARQLDYREPIQTNSNSVMLQSMIKKWYSKCKTAHEWCQDWESRRPKFAPDRLIYIKSPNEIHLSTDHLKDCSYLALTYCWGARTIFSTTIENFESHRRQIPWSSLPLTLRQAIELTETLGFRYIWIDSLCIIQQDKEDWARQCKVMGDVYTNAAIVLSASSASSVHEGLHQPREYATMIIEIPPQKRVQRKDTEGPYNNDNVRRPESPTVAQSILDSLSKKSDSETQQDTAVHDFSIVDRLFVSPNALENPWKTVAGKHRPYDRFPTEHRAWCFQEHRLASRILHFAKEELYWECGTGSACECGQMQREKYDNDILLTRFLSPSTIREVGQVIDMLNFWGESVENFSYRKLSVITDCLPAIAGLATRLQCPELGEYHAGIWTGLLPYGLLWNTERFHDIRRPDVYIGPTWSWVSLPGTEVACLKYRNCVPASEVINVQSTPRTSNPFGEIDSASITISGKTSRYNTIQSYIDPEYKDRRFILTNTKQRLPPSESLELKPQPLDAWNIQTKFYPDLSDSTVQCYPEGVLLLVLVKRGGKSTGNSFSEGLVLTESRTHHGSWERIGIFTGPNGNDWEHKIVTII